MEVVEKRKKPTIWEYLAPTDLAESVLERAESLSKNGKLHESLQAFRQAARIFAEIESFLDVKDWEVEDEEERTQIHEMRDAAQSKRNYCLTRISQAARELGIEGDAASSV